jgi:hypothetical protein
MGRPRRRADIALMGLTDPTGRHQNIAGVIVPHGRGETAKPLARRATYLAIP